VYVSTNFVFDGEMSRPYHEFDTPNPINVYGASKLAGEVETREALERAYIVRTAMVFDEVGRNFVNTMRRLMAERPRLTVVADQVGNPTYASDLAAGIIRLVGRAPYGTYHLTNGGVASWFEWAQTVAELTGSTTEIVPIPASEYQRAARPPANGSMISLALPSLGVCLPDWRDALSRCLGR
jgi:dTDP-4-dehydrorhamnose reductase